MTLNLDPVETLCNAIVESDLPTRLLYISSDYVFDAKQGNYSVDSPVNPTTVYGRSKVLAEDRVLRGDIPGCVIRTAAVMGCSGGFLSWLIDALETPETVELFGNSFFSPTPVQMLADCITEILCTEMSERQRIYHAVGPERMSRFDFGCLIRDLLQESGAPVAAELLKGGKGLGSDLSLVPNVTPYSVGTERLDFRDYLRVELSSCIRN